jgi:hypothetical protein
LKIWSLFCFSLSIAIGTLHVGCGLYSFTDTAVDARVKTVSVKDFANSAANVQPSLSLAISEKLRTKIQRETRLQLTQTNADARFSGAIVGYYVAPAASGGNDQSQLNRLTVTVRVEYINPVTKTNWSQTFEQYENFDRNANLSSVEEPCSKLSPTALLMVFLIKHSRTGKQTKKSLYLCPPITLPLLF